MSEARLVPGDEHPISAIIRKAIGAGTFDEVNVMLPQFERNDGKTISFRPDKTVAFFDQLKRAPEAILLDIGMQRWDETLLLFPHEWYDYIPEGYIVTDILGDDKPFRHGTSDDDKRFGALPYGFKMEHPQ